MGQGTAYHSTFQRPFPPWSMSMEPKSHSGHLRARRARSAAALHHTPFYGVLDTHLPAHGIPCVVQWWDCCHKAMQGALCAVCTTRCQYALCMRRAQRGGMHACARLLLTNPVCHSEVGIGVVPSPEPVPRYMMHMPHAAPAANWGSLSAMVLLDPLLQGKCTVLAKFWL